ncbi:MAG: sodium:solute symporter [Lachnospiraceae bacterium]
MTRWEKTAISLAAILTIVITSYSYIKLIGTGILSWHIRQPETKAMIMELGIIWLLLFLFLFHESGTRRRIVGCMVLIAGFCWLHQIFLPVLLAGVYIGYLILTGRNAGRILKQVKLGLAWEFCIGTIAVILIFCLLSLLQLGSIRNLRIWTLVTGVIQVVYEMFWWRRLGVQVPQAAKQNIKTGSGRLLAAAVTAAVVTLILLQAGRMNLAVDFDSIWYGVRSAVMLDSGSSIYDNLGTLGVVYTYPKGWEVLTLPLTGLPSYSFPIAFNLWAAVLVLLASRDTAAVWMNRERAIGVPFLMAAIPGIMNMSITAKADILTLFYQILILQSMLRFIRDRKMGHLAFGLAAAGISLTMKPTALVFSSALVGMSLIWLAWDRCQPADQGGHAIRYIRSDNRRWWLVAAAAAALAGIWGRTMKLVGIPVTSVFYQVFQKLGFQIKYPFYASAFPSAASSMTAGEKIGFYIKRLYGILLNPQGGDMAHVIIAWGTVFPLIFLVLLLCFRKRSNSGPTSPVLSYLAMVLSGVLFVNLLSLYSLYQIDGNYYILFYALLIIGGGVWLDSRAKPLRRAGAGMLLIPWFYAAVLCCITNWSWSLGFSPVQISNNGYYNHTEKYRQEHAGLGCREIWNELAADPDTRVIALGEHPRVLTFPCNVQSYVDVSGYWGNPVVVSDAEHFLEYLHYAKTDYIYMEQQYVDTSVRIYQIIRTLIQEGWLYDVRDENGNLIMRVAHSDPDQSTAEVNLETFDERYIQHP